MISICERCTYYTDVCTESYEIYFVIQVDQMCVKDVCAICTSLVITNVMFCYVSQVRKELLCYTSVKAAHMQHVSSLHRKEVKWEVRPGIEASAKDPSKKTSSSNALGLKVRQAVRKWQI